VLSQAEQEQKTLVTQSNGDDICRHDAAVAIVRKHMLNTFHLAQELLGSILYVHCICLASAVYRGHACYVTCSLQWVGAHLVPVAHALGRHNVTVENFE
jgi:hypothetical protein